jgi:acetyltransferase
MALPTTAEREALHGRWPKFAHTSDGTRYHIRPIAGSDADRERAFFATLSEQSKYLRFLHCMGDPTDAFVAQLVNVDYHDTMALVAAVGTGSAEHFIGVARYAVDACGRGCEFAVAVSDDWQCRGIGTTLMPHLFEYAAGEGFDSIYGTILADNHRMVEMMQWLGLVIEPVVDDRTMLRAVKRLR